MTMHHPTGAIRTLIGSFLVLMLTASVPAATPAPLVAPGTKVEKLAGEASVSNTDLMDTIRTTVNSMTGEAEEDDSNDSQADRVIQNTLGNLTGEIRRSLQFFENQSRSQPVRRIVIGGGTANCEGLASYLEKELNLSV